MPPENSDEPLPSENSVGSLPLVNSGESLPLVISGESLPLVNSGESLPLVNSGESLPPEDTGESLPLVGSDSDLIYNNRPISSRSTRCRSTSSAHRFRCNYNNCRRTFRSQGELQEHQYQHDGRSPFICFVEDCASFGTTYANRSNLRRHYNHYHPNEHYPQFRNRNTV
ncbi:hypothetical protein C2G38_2044885 [Gigaspora rosea]|uniref:C2H2-type domain-containing protein n=1 Tax=Gigaspora rosea TaxID=44941 RepID=A0A397UEM8_9GLOM|nr:hypothetical protein C2G38_2044885 [Gigaspora rosea]